MASIKQLKSLLKLNNIKKIKEHILDLIENNELSENIKTEDDSELDNSNNSEESDYSEEIVIEKTKSKPKNKKRKLSKYNIFMSEEMKRLKKNGIDSDKLFSTAVKNWNKSK
jgi:YABBY protein